MKLYSLSEKVTWKKIALVMAGLFFVSLLPILWCSLFDYATGDDLWEGAAAYRVLAENGTFKEFVTAVYQWAKVDYLGWEGNWFSIILWCLEPSIWGEKVYCITPWIALIALCGGTAYFLWHFLKKYLGCDNSLPAITSVMLCFFAVQYMPYIKSGIFWYTGMINYVVPYGICLASFVWIDKYLAAGGRKYLIFVTLFFACLGGSGYIPVVLAFEILFLAIVSQIRTGREQKGFGALWLLLPMILLVAGFVFSALSPGNAVRGGESYRFSAVRILWTVLESVRQGLLGAVSWFISVRPLFLTVPLLVILTWEQTDVGRIRLNLKHPAMVILFLFLISCSVYAPGIYAESDVSGGVPDTIYFVFLMTYTLGVIYLTCYIKKTAMEKKRRVPSGRLTGRIRLGVMAGTVLFCLAAGKYLIGNMTAYVCLDFIRTGQLADFEYQMQERLSILQDPEITEVVLPEMNDEQGPFMHMALMPDPEAYTNQATARFYGKESVIAIPRAEYYKLYGEPEEKADR